MEARKGSAWRTINTGEAYANAAWRALKYGEAYKGGAWRTIVSFVQPMSIAITPSFGSWGGSGDTVTSGNHLGSVTGGLAPFTYQWVKLSGDDITINTPTRASTTFTGTTEPSVTATFRVTATDALGTTATDTVEVTLFHTEGPGGTE